MLLATEVGTSSYLSRLTDPYFLQGYPVDCQGVRSQCQIWSQYYQFQEEGEEEGHRQLLQGVQVQARMLPEQAHPHRPSCHLFVSPSSKEHQHREQSTMDIRRILNKIEKHAIFFNTTICVRLHKNKCLSLPTNQNVFVRT